MASCASTPTHATDVEHLPAPTGGRARPVRLTGLGRYVIAAVRREVAHRNRVDGPT